MVIELFEAWPDDTPVGSYETDTKILHIFRPTTTMLYADIDWIITVGQFQLNPLRHAPTKEERKAWIAHG
jgi:hypothetical protein